MTLEKSDLQQTRKVVAVVDAIAANPGVRLPWKEMVAICRDAGVWSVVDAAHSIGQEVDINLSEAKPDFWISTCHKWLFAKRSCAVLYVPKRMLSNLVYPLHAIIAHLETRITMAHKVS